MHLLLFCRSGIHERQNSVARRRIPLLLHETKAIDIGIALSLMPDCRRRAMPTVYGKFVGQRHELFFDGSQEILGGRAWKIRPADGFGKQRVAAENAILHEVADAAWGMSGRMEHGELHAADLQDLAAFQKSIGGARHDRHAHKGGQVLLRIEEHRRISLMDIKLSTRFLAQKVDGANMVGMSMRVENRLEVQSIFLDMLPYSLFAAARIDRYRLFASFLMQNIAVDAERPYHERLHVQTHNSSSLADVPRERDTL